MIYVALLAVALAILIALAVFANFSCWHASCYERESE